jgi:hypothetical protein
MDFFNTEALEIIEPLSVSAYGLLLLYASETLPFFTECCWVDSAFFLHIKESQIQISDWRLAILTVWDIISDWAKAVSFHTFSRSFFTNHLTILSKLLKALLNKPETNEWNFSFYRIVVQMFGGRFVQWDITFIFTGAFYHSLSSCVTFQAENWLKACAIAWVIIHQLCTASARLWFQIILCRISGDIMTVGQLLWFLLLPNTPHSLIILSLMLYSHNIDSLIKYPT